MSGRPVYRGCKSGIPKSSTSAASNNQLFPVSGQVRDKLIGFKIIDHGSNRHLNYNIFTIFATHVFPFAMSASFCNIVLMVFLIKKGVQIRGGFYHNIPSLTTIPPVRSAALDIFLTPETHTPVSAITSMNKYFYSVYEHI